MSPNLSSPERMSIATERDHATGVRRWLVASSLGVLLIGGGFLAWRFLGGRKPPAAMSMPPGVPVRLAAVQTGKIQETSELLGRLEAQTGVALQPEVSGRITQIFVAAGDRVTAGTPIALISPERTQAEVNAAAAGVVAAQSAQSSAEASLRSLLARQTELEANLRLQQTEFGRTQTLVEQGAQSQQALDVAQRNLEAAKAALASAREEIAAAQARLDQATATLEQTQANQAATAQDLQDRTVLAPIDGVVGALNAKLGDFVSSSTVLTNITENATLDLNLNVPVEDRDRLRLGLPVQILAAKGSDVIASGTITFISPQTDANTQTVLIKARFNNAGGTLQDAQQVEARILWAEKTGVLVPTSAITRLGGQTFVYVADEGTPEELPPAQALPPGMPPLKQVARLRPVQLGEIQGNNFQVLSGLKPGETIVVSGILNLRDGTPLIPQAPDANPAPASKP